MANRLNTIIIVPHSRAKFVKFSFSTRALILTGVAVLVGALLSLAAIGYTGNAVSRRAELHRLETENRELAEVNTRLEETVVRVQGQLDEFEERTARLALAAGMDTEAGGSASFDGGNQTFGSGGPYDRLPEEPAVLSRQGDRIGQQLDLVEEALDEQSRQLACTPTIAPVAGIYTDGYGRRKDPFTGRSAFHRGLDMSARRGTPVVAPADGVVVFAGRNGGLGRVVRLSHGFGYTTVFGHLEKILVEPGQEVRRGEVIGNLGNSGRSTGPHLHYEVHVDGKSVNPLYYVLDF
jgi:murein DD-endopeptidase MepM/ murein hydrolase activator NlpD